MTPAVMGFDHAHVFVADRERALPWYARVLGLAPLPEFAHWAEGRGPLVVANEGGTMCLALFERPAPATGMPAFAVTAPAFRAWQAHLSATMGEAPEWDDHGQAQSLYFSDPDGNCFELVCYEVAALNARA